MPSAVGHLEVYTAADGRLDVAWTIEGTPVAVDLAVGTTPEHIDHAHQLTVAAGVTRATVPAGAGARTFVSVAPHGGGPAAVAADRRVPFEGSTNFRDLGGYPTADGGRIRWGQVFRADSLHALTSSDLELYERLGMRTVYDLRGADERAARPNPMPSTWLALLTPRITDEAVPTGPMTEHGEAALRTIYVRLVEHAAPTIGSLLTGLAGKDGTPAVFHCHAGKDRTGVVAAVLLLALGVDRDLVLDDYELTARYRLRTHQEASYQRLVEGGMAPEAAAAVLTTPRWAMAAALDAIESDHGGIEVWLTNGAGVSKEALTALRERLVANASA